MKNKIHIINMEIFFLILVMIFSPIRNVQATAGCCIAGGTNGTAVSCILPAVSATGQKSCPSGNLFTNDCSSIAICSQATNSTNGTNSNANLPTAGCCIAGGTNGTAVSCILPAVSATGQKSCPSGNLFTNDCSSIAICSQATNSTNGNNSTTNTGTFPTNNTATNTTNANSATPTAFTIPTGFGFPDPQGGVTAIIKNLLDWLLGIIGAIAIIAFVISGAQYLMASGNERIIEVAKRNMFYSILGVIVALSGAVIITAIDAALRAWVLF